MATVAEVKQMMLNRLAAMDLEHMSLTDTMQYVTVLRTLADIADQSVYSSMLDILKDSMGNIKPQKPTESVAYGYEMGGE